MKLAFSNFRVGNNRSGTIFERTAKSKLITSDKYLIDGIHYIHTNSLKHGIVVNPDNWEFSSLSEYLGEENVLVSKRILGNYFHRDFTYQTSFQEYMESKKFEEELD
ncbi:MAG: hypothetical protein H8E11_04080 [Candidatus Cloacimonetes bacterium]|nr:hypothetical protein [Candidatus Cloacimonadota bacterium]